jgi:hypothetical protein
MCRLTKWHKCHMQMAMQLAMHLVSDMVASMHKMHNAEVALTYARGHAAPTGGGLTVVVP